MGRNFYQLCCGQWGSWKKSLIGPFSMAFKPQWFFASQSKTWFSLLPPAPLIPPQCSWQGGQLCCSLMEEAILKGDMEFCQPCYFLISRGFQQNEFTTFRISVSGYLVYFVCFHWSIKTQAHYQHIFTPADGCLFSCLIISSSFF